MKVDRFKVQTQNSSVVDGTVVNLMNDEYILAAIENIPDSTDQVAVFVHGAFHGDITMSIGELEAIPDSDIMMNYIA